MLSDKCWVNLTSGTAYMTVKRIKANVLERQPISLSSYFDLRLLLRTASILGGYWVVDGQQEILDLCEKKWPNRLAVGDYDRGKMTRVLDNLEYIFSKQGDWFGKQYEECRPFSDHEQPNLLESMRYLHSCYPTLPEPKFSTVRAIFGCDGDASHSFREKLYAAGVFQTSTKNYDDFTFEIITLKGHLQQVKQVFGDIPIDHTISIIESDLTETPTFQDD